MAKTLRSPHREGQNETQKVKLSFFYSIAFKNIIHYKQNFRHDYIYAIRSWIHLHIRVVVGLLHVAQVWILIAGTIAVVASWAWNFSAFVDWHTDQIANGEIADEQEVIVEVLGESNSGTSNLLVVVIDGNGEVGNWSTNWLTLFVRYLSVFRILTVLVK